MVGSAGISAHKTVQKKISAYAPNDNDAFEAPNKATAPVEVAVEPLHASGDWSLDSFGEMNMMNQGNFLLQAEDCREGGQRLDQPLTWLTDSKTCIKMPRWIRHV